MIRSEKIISFLKQYRYEIFALVVLLIYLSPNIFFPEEARHLIHDNLDSNVVWYKNLAESGKMFGDNNDLIDISLGGIPRGCYPSEWNIMHLLYLIFPTQVAYNINSIIMHMVAFFGMLLLIRRYFKRIKNEGVMVFVALLFSLLPFWPSGGMAIAGQPLLIYSLLNIHFNKSSVFDWLCLIFIPFYSLFALSNLFFIFIVVGLLLIYTLKSKTIHWRLMLALTLFVVATIFAELRLFEMQFIDHFQSHRDNVRTLGTLNIKGLIGVSLLHFIKGQYHFHSLHFPLVFIAIIAAIIGGSLKQRWIIIVSLSVLFLFSVVLVLPSLNSFEQFFSRSDLLNKVTLRFYSLFPVLWFILLAYSLTILDLEKLNIKRMVLFGLCVQLFIQLFSINSKDYQGCDFSENTFYRTYFDTSNDEYSTFKNYYRTDIYSNVKSKIDLTKYSVCVGISPEVAHYNNIRTIDGYFYYYSKKHYLVMKRINAKIDLHKRIDRSGNLSKLVIPDFKGNDMRIVNPEWDFTLLDSLNVRNFISVYLIDSKELVFVERVGTSEYPIFIYNNNIN
jgi:hypothetical protein